MFNPVKASENIKDSFVSYIETTFHFADDKIQRQFCDELNHMVATGPWLQINDIFKSGKTIRKLIQEGTLSHYWEDLESGKPKAYKRCIPLDRPLYLHQEKAIERIVFGHNAVISTGTGSGKTNCFLIPVINELLREKEKGMLGPGIRAIFIYPMNALANDQLKNIRNLLMYYPSITFGVYTGSTEEDQDKAVQVYQAMFRNEQYPELQNALPNELLSREKMKKNPPHILFTNYAMLEHLLFRPADDALFSHSSFKFVVLDEAHIYSGATGIETSLLLRRLRARINSKSTQFILTSATLGKGKESNPEILQFANSLCGVPFSEEDIIQSTREAFTPAKVTTHCSLDVIRELADDKNNLDEVFQKHSIPSDTSKTEAERLYDFLEHLDLYIKFRNITTRQSKAGHNAIKVGEIAKGLELDLDTAVSFIYLCTKANKNGKALIDARYHFFIRGLEGGYIELGPDKKFFLSRQKEYQDHFQKYSVFEVAICDRCGSYALVGKLDKDKLTQVSKIEQKEVMYFYNAKEENNDIENDEEVPDKSDSKKEEAYYLCPHCGAVVKEDRFNPPICDCGKNDYVKIVKVNTLKVGARCGNCHQGKYMRLYLGSDAATSVLATSLYEELPGEVYRKVVTSSQQHNIFIQADLANQNSESKSDKRKQFLCFSDGRQEAALFACYLSNSYQEFLRRRGICQIIAKHKDLLDNKDIKNYVDLLTSFFDTKRVFRENWNDHSALTVISRRQAWVAMMDELIRFESPTSLTSLGILQFEYIGNQPIVKTFAEWYKIKENDAKNLLNLLAFEIVKSEAICTNKNDLTSPDLNDQDREYIFYSPSQRYLSKNPQSNQSVIRAWLPKAKDGQGKRYNKPSKLYYVCKFLNCTEEAAYKILDQYFDYLTDSSNVFCMKDKGDGSFVMPAEYFRVKLAGNPDAHWFKCRTCGKVSPFNIKGRCVSFRCDGLVDEIKPESLSVNNHFAKLYKSNQMDPLFIKEHTAQLSKKESAEYQQEFIRKEINALSCSTTFEMGVDVGDLETVFLRDVPPTPSNYAQRAGRAGRSLNAAAYALTFAKLSSHDLSFFNKPEDMIEGTIKPPLFKVDNEKIAKRHIYAVALAMFFKDHPDMYNKNNGEKFINQGGYKEFEAWLRTKPDRLKNLLNESIPDINDLHNRMGLEDFSWVDKLLFGKKGDFTLMMTEYNRNIQQFEALIEKYKNKGNNFLQKAVSAQRREKKYSSNRLIDFLARGNILPRYGFPVDTVELEQNTGEKNDNDPLRLTRSMEMAIAEYAPSSEVIANGKMYTSRYIKKAFIDSSDGDRQWDTGWIAQCPECKTMKYRIPELPKGTTDQCSNCKEELGSELFQHSIEPRAGFITEEGDKPVPLSRPEKNYRSEDFYIGNTESNTIEHHKYRLNGNIVSVESTTNDSLLVKSSTYFYVCPKCGYAISRDERLGVDATVAKGMERGDLKIKANKEHNSCYGNFKCSSLDLEKYTLHYKFNTDVAKIDFGCDTSDLNTMLSVMYALLYTMCDYLNIERKDLKACLETKIKNRMVHRSIVIYDAVPGGAGHSRRLLTGDGRLLEIIIQKAKERMERCHCNPSCYSCLRSYENQRIHDQLDRTLAMNFLGKLIGSVEVVEDEEEAK